MKRLIFTLAFSVLLITTIAQNYDTSEGLTGETLEYYQKAKNGDAQAQYKLAMCYQYGIKTKIDKKKALYWATKAAEQGDIVAAIYLAKYYENFNYETGEKLDKNEYIYWYRKAAEGGCIYAQTQLAHHYESVDTVEEKYLYWLRKAAEQGDGESQLYLASHYQRNDDKSQALSWLRRAAGQDYAEAQFNLGECYMRGDMVPQEKEKAIYWFTKAAGQGNIEYQKELARLYEGENDVITFGDSAAIDEGNIVNDNNEAEFVDYNEAIKWYGKAAEQGDIESYIHIAMCYEKLQNKAQVSYYYNKAEEKAKKGDTEAQINLANSFKKVGNTEKAIYWYRKAVDNSNKEETSIDISDSDVYFDLADLYEDSGDKSQAIYFYKKAATGSINKEISQQRLGKYYEEGDGVAQDYNEAIYWYRRVAEDGRDLDATLRLSRCYEKIHNKEKADYWYRKAIEYAEQDGNYWQLAQFFEEVAQDKTKAIYWYRKAAKKCDYDWQKDACEEKLRELGAQ